MSATATGCSVLRHPSRDSLPQPQLEAIHDVGMRVLGGAKNQLAIFERVEEAGIAAHHRGREIDDVPQYFL